MAAMTLLVAILVCFLSLCSAAPTLIYPKADGSSTKDLDEGIAVGSNAFTVTATTTITSVTVVSAMYLGTDLKTDFDDTSAPTVKTAIVLDYETTPSYIITIQVDDGTGAVTTKLTLQVRDLTDESPVLGLGGNAAATVAWDEEQDARLTVFSAFAVTDTDAADAGKHIFSLSGPQQNFFTVEPDTGQIIINNKLDREAAGTLSSYSLLLTVTDTGGLTDSMALTVTLSDINDNVPVCSPPLYSTSLPENTAAGATVAVILGCTDVDDGANGDVKTYSILSGDDTPPKFEVKNTNEIHTTATPLDFETKTLYTLKIGVLDDGTPPLTGTATILVQVGNENEAPPVWGTFSPSIPSIPKPESVGLTTPVVTITASDTDDGDDGQVVYSLLSVTEQPSGSSVTDILRVDPVSGEVVTISLLDRDGGVTSYTFVVMAKDKGNPPQSAIQTLTLTLTDVNDNAPQFPSTFYSATIDENNARAKVWSGLPVTAGDKDPDTGVLVYGIIGGNVGNKFKVSAAGQLELDSAIDVDNPTADPYSYVLIVTVTDQGIPAPGSALTGTTTVTVTISPVSNNHAPSFATPDPSATPTVSETAPLATSVARLPVTDLDLTHGASQTMTYSITGGNTNDDFDIDSRSGVVTTARTLDFERTQSYDLVVRATDSGTPPQSTDFTLKVSVDNVNDDPPSCPAYTMYATVPENSPAQKVVSLACTQSDLGDSIRYSISSVTAFFNIPVNTADVWTLTALDYETASSHTVEVTVSDTLSPVQSVTVTLTVLVTPVNEHDPVFFPLSYSKVLPENTPPNTLVAEVRATDADQGAKDGTVRYSIVAGNGQGQFTINPTTGDVKTTSVGLDFETDVTHRITVYANDDEPGLTSERTASVTVVVTVTDVNDNVPLCVPVNYVVSVTEPSSAGTEVASLTVRDDDKAGTDNSNTELTILTGNTDTVFAISGHKVVLAKAANYEAHKSFSLAIRVSDKGTLPGPLTSTCSVQVTIVDFNEFPPVLSETNKDLEIPETTVVGTVLYDADATDSDQGLGSTVTYRIISGDPNNDFQMYSHSGQLVVWNRLDYDSPPQTYTLVVEAVDDAGLSDTMTVNIKLTDVNDQTPVFKKNIYNVAVDENVVIGTVIATVIADDDDTDVRGFVTYEVVSGNGKDLFDVNPTTGEVFTTAEVDREVWRDYSLVVQAKDGGTPPLSSTTHVAIVLNDLNDNAPIFTPKDFAVFLSEDAAVGTSVTTVRASDKDSSASNNVFTYVLVSNFFAVDSATGVITTTRALDRETDASYVLQVVAPDQGAPPRRGTASVTVLLTDVNDNPPVIEGTPNPTVSVSEDAPLNTVVTTVTATDADDGDNARLKYVISGGDPNGDFVISDVNGIIQVAKGLDRESAGQYDLVVVVSDHGVPSLSVTSTVTVNLLDVNDNPPVWAAPSYAFTVSENVPAGTLVGKVEATDKDVGVNAALTYTLVQFWPGSKAHFSINGANGRISTTEVLDRESTAQYTFLVRVTDAGNPQLHAEKNVTITVTDLNDNAPVFDKTLYSASVIEHSAVGTGVLTVTVTDADIDVNDDVTLSIDTTTAEGVKADSVFQISSASGVLSVKGVIDRETDSSFTFTLKAVDRGTPAHTSSADVIITVVDVNDNLPVFTKTFYNMAMDYAGKCTKSIVTLTATDADTNINAEPRYYMPTSNVDHLFEVNSTSGELSLESSLTAESIYVVTVSARDAGTPTQNADPPAVVRVDAMIPNQVVVVFKLGVTVDAFLAEQNTFLQQLQTVVRATHPTAVAKLWCAESAEDGLADVHVYFLADDSTESVANINAAKFYLSQDQVRAIFTSDPEGTPGSVLAGSEWSSFGIRSVQPYVESQKPWLETWEGIALLTLICVMGAALLALAVYMVLKYCRVHRIPPPRKIFVREQPRDNRVQPQREAPKITKPKPMTKYEDEFFWDSRFETP